MGAEAVEILPRLIEQYPYCATYKVLYCIALANTHSTQLKAEVERTACCIPDRTRLFTLINNGEHEWIRLMKQLDELHAQQQPVEEEDTFELIDLYLSQQHLPESMADGITALTDVSDYPLDNLENCKPILDDDEDEGANEEGGQQDELIDQFLEADQQGELLVPKAEHNANDAPTPDPDLIREKAFLTESLARLYVKQHKFEQALAIFSRLNLQYSKKSNNFADQIRYLEKLIEFEKET